MVPRPKKPSKTEILFETTIYQDKAERFRSDVVNHSRKLKETHQKKIQKDQDIPSIPIKKATDTQVVYSH